MQTRMNAGPDLLSPSSPLWVSADTIGNYYYLTGEHTWVIYPFSPKLKKRIRLVRTNNYLHFMDSGGNITFYFKRYKHRGVYLWADSRDCIRNARKNPTRTRDQVVDEIGRMMFGGDLVAANVFVGDHLGWE